MGNLELETTQLSERQFLRLFEFLSETGTTKDGAAGKIREKLAEEDFEARALPKPPPKPDFKGHQDDDEEFLEKSNGVNKKGKHKTSRKLQLRTKAKARARVLKQSQSLKHPPKRSKRHMK